MQFSISKPLLVWLLLMAGEIVNGTVRRLFIEPQLGAFRARQIGVGSGSLLILAIGTGTIRWLGIRGAKQLLTVGACWVVLTLAFEVSIGRAVGRTWSDIGSDFDLVHGGLLALGFVLLFFAPLIAARLRRI